MAHDADSRPSDVLLVEQVDRLSRLTTSDWQKLRAELDAKRVRVVALDLPKSWMLAAPADEFTGRNYTGRLGKDRSRPDARDRP
jgi:DNA invertase Pin-like site-specific DNA recombinase